MYVRGSRGARFATRGCNGGCIRDDDGYMAMMMSAVHNRAWTGVEHRTDETGRDTWERARDDPLV